MSIDVQLMHKRKDGEWAIIGLPKKEVLKLGYEVVEGNFYPTTWLIDPKTEGSIGVTHQDDTNYECYVCSPDDENYAMLHKLKDLGQKLFPDEKVEVIDDCQHYPIFWGIEDPETEQRLGYGQTKN